MAVWKKKKRKEFIKIWEKGGNKEENYDYERRRTVGKETEGVKNNYVVVEKFNNN